LKSGESFRVLLEQNRQTVVEEAADVFGVELQQNKNKQVSLRDRKERSAKAKRTVVQVMYERLEALGGYDCLRAGL
jgi:hypothetical protein